MAYQMRLYILAGFGDKAPYAHPEISIKATRAMNMGASLQCRFELASDQ
jgi:hypothetical protein